MLVLKKDVTPKDLEKYGFRPIYNEYTGEIEKYIQQWGYQYCDDRKRPFIKFLKKQVSGKKIIPKNISWYRGEFVIPDNGLNREYFFDTFYHLVKDGLIVDLESDK